MTSAASDVKNNDSLLPYTSFMLSKPGVPLIQLPAIQISPLQVACSPVAVKTTGSKKP